MVENKSVLLSYAGALQEVGILFFVFGPMYLTFESELDGWLLAIGVLTWVIFAFIVFRLGIEIQRRD